MYTEAELSRMPVDELRKMGAGKITGIKTLKKGELVQKLLESQGVSNNDTIAAKIGYKGVLAHEPEIIGNKIFRELVHILIENKYPLQQVVMLGNAVAYKETHAISENTGKPFKGQTLNNRRTQIIAAIKNKISANYDPNSNEAEQLEEYVGLIMTCFSGAFNNIGSVSGREREIAISEISSNRPKRDEHNLLLWAIEVLDSIEQQERWQDLCCAIAIVTGRRESEILATGIFTPTDEKPYDDILLDPSIRLHYLGFAGQLKGKVLSPNRIRPYAIPVLYNNEKILAALQKLEAMEIRKPLPLEPLKTYGERQRQASVAVNRSYSSSLSKNMNRLAQLSEEKVKFHDLRAIYGTVFLALIDFSGRMAQDQFYSLLLGHDLSRGKSQSTDHYMLFGLSPDWKDKLISLYKQI
jgi:hypothetical protein